MLKKRPSEAVAEQLRRQPAGSLFTSVICVMELRYGAARLPDGERLWSRIATELLPTIEVLSLGLDEARTAGEVLASLAAKGQPIGVEDVLIGATALNRHLAVVTRNVRHLERIRGLDVISWWVK